MDPGSAEVVAILKRYPAGKAVPVYYDPDNPRDCIPEKDAEALLIQSFVGEAIDTVGNEIVRDALTVATTQWLAGRS